MIKIIFLILGVLLVLFGIHQALQLVGLIGGPGFTVWGLVLAILGFVLGGACLGRAKMK